MHSQTTSSASTSKAQIERTPKNYRELKTRRLILKEEIQDWFFQQIDTVESLVRNCGLRYGR